MSETPQEPSDAKQSFESNPEVQRWLKTQAESSQESFQPTFLSSHHERDWILSSLALFYQRRLITDILSLVKPGKEATVYCCQAHPETGAGLLAAKVYRPRMFRSLKDDAVYRENRAVGRDQRRRRAILKKSRMGRAFQVEDWLHYEYETQSLLYAAGGDVPRPFAQEGNAMLMAYIGDREHAAPRLHEVSLSRQEAPALFEQLLQNVELFLAHDRIHGDLSAYNVLYWEGHLTIIDFAQAVDARQGPQVLPLLVRDIERLCDYFAPFGVHAQPTQLSTALWKRYQYCRGRHALRHHRRRRHRRSTGRRLRHRRGHPPGCRRRLGGLLLSFQCSGRPRPALCLG
ncbi:MAG: hypothetical protein HYW07_15760 [Candidatus Latescibacteria bacterium]|nr:hypothetical protein [Candidatus Latescibacterota bacterium]